MACIHECDSQKIVCSSSHLHHPKMHCRSSIVVDIRAHISAVSFDLESSVVSIGMIWYLVRFADSAALLSMIVIL
jgi:hypothetical protein